MWAEHVIATTKKEHINRRYTEQTNFNSKKVQLALVVCKHWYNCASMHKILAAASNYAMEGHANHAK